MESQYVLHEITILHGNICRIWTATQDIQQRKLNYPHWYRYGLNLEIDDKIHVFCCMILLAGDVATNPGPSSLQYVRCLSFNARSIKSTIKLHDGTTASNLRTFQDLVYAEELDMILVT